MIDPALLLAFLAAATVLTLTPGVDTAMVLRAATVEGGRSAVRAALGICLGCLVWGGAVSFGLGAVLHAWPLAFAVLRYAGAAYLLWLGVKLLLRPRAALDMAAGDPRRARGAFGRGLLTNLLNPKIGVFYLTFLPQFVPTGGNVAAWCFVLAAIHVALSLAWFAALIGATAPLSRALRRPRAVATLDRLTGLVFVGFGVKLAASSTR